MNQSQIENTQKNENQIEIKKKVFLFLHNDNFDEKNLEPIVLTNNERIYVVFLKKTAHADIYYIFDDKKYLKLWLDKKENLLTYFNNWTGDLFISNTQTTEYIDGYNFTITSDTLICEDRERKRKTIKLEGFDILPVITNIFERHANAILYLICTKLS
jgi:hypothetical protein